MAAKVINLRRARKAKARAVAESKAAENRVVHGRSKPARAADAAERDRADRRLDAAKRSDADRTE